MGKASFECWKEMKGQSSIRTLDNMHDYALELALLGHEEDGIAMWQEIVERCPASDSSENTKTVFTTRSMAGVAEFKGDAAIAEIFYAKLISLSEAMYFPEHIHVFDYRLSHAEQIMRQGRLEEASGLSEAILASCNNTSEWRISVSCLQTIAECWRLRACYSKEQTYRLSILNSHEKYLGRHHKETIDAEDALADCYLKSCRYSEAESLYNRVLALRDIGLGRAYSDTVRAIECLASIGLAERRSTGGTPLAYESAIARC